MCTRPGYAQASGCKPVQPDRPFTSAKGKSTGQVGMSWEQDCQAFGVTPRPAPPQKENSSKAQLSTYRVPGQRHMQTKIHRPSQTVALCPCFSSSTTAKAAQNGDCSLHGVLGTSRGRVSNTAMLRAGRESVWILSWCVLKTSKESNLREASSNASGIVAKRNDTYLEHTHLPPRAKEPGCPAHLVDGADHQLILTCPKDLRIPG